MGRNSAWERLESTNRAIAVAVVLGAAGVIAFFAFVWFGAPPSGAEDADAVLGSVVVVALYSGLGCAELAYLLLRARSVLTPEHLILKRFAKGANEDNEYFQRTGESAPQADLVAQYHRIRSGSLTIPLRDIESSAMSGDDRRIIWLREPARGYRVLHLHASPKFLRKLDDRLDFYGTAPRGR